jgi:hypothetical protein
MDYGVRGLFFSYLKICLTLDSDPRHGHEPHPVHHRFPIGPRIFNILLRSLGVLVALFRFLTQTNGPRNRRINGHWTVYSLLLNNLPGHYLLRLGTI